VPAGIDGIGEAIAFAREKAKVVLSDIGRSFQHYGEAGA
jgi:hypothetical protein